ncbi:glycosyltransferase family 4 protein [Patescibacteria group bacterium]|nr:glycosyltransferase family 4 protein [Patescibacteria group bacterium]MBU1563621.1 glycosyltransferase family 4 protein [Patescibacteria group bacterium]MBU2068041.1 glycosyltransferase family 4 protein [Patescibacteria group bacterium]
MNIGINAMAAFKEPRTGVEEYSYQLIKHLAMLEGSKKHRFVLYSDKNLKWPLPMWTQIRLSAEMVFNRPDVLFIPVHVLPLVHPKNSVVTIHGLEYEYYPEMYLQKHRRYLRWSTKYALKNAHKIIAVSENTKKDLVELYGGDPDKIYVIHHGVDIKRFNIGRDSTSESTKPYILYLGRLETKKNVQGLVRAFELLKKRHQVPHQLILVGAQGYGYDKIKLEIRNSKFEISELGYVSEEKKWQLLKNADMFIFPSFYEGFGIPILEAQSVGCPVITSNVSSMPEVAGQGAVLVESRNAEEICQRMYQIIEDQDFKKRLISQGYENVKKFSWQKCAQETLSVLTGL